TPIIDITSGNATDEGSETVEHRAALIRAIAEADPAAARRYTHALFLDSCEPLVKTDALAAFVDSWLAANSVANAATNFVALRAATGPSRFNPHNVLAGRVAWHWSDNEDGKDISDGERAISPIPGSSAMFVELAAWRRVESAANSAASLPFVRVGDKAACGMRDELSRFWTAVALAGLSGELLDADLVVTTPKTPSSAVTGHLMPCEVDVRASGGLVTRLAAIKALWRPAVTVVLPFYRPPSAEWFREALASLWAQSFRDFEVVIVDDGSACAAACRWWPWTGQGCTACPVLEDLERRVAPAAAGAGGTWDGNLHDGIPRLPSFVGTSGAAAADRASSATAAAIPMRVLRHTRNLGLAEARNTGVAAARASFVFFLDADDAVAPLALEKLVLAARAAAFTAATDGRHDPRVPAVRRSPAFIFPGVVHVDAVNSNEDADGPWRVRDPPAYWDFDASTLPRENRLTSAALVSVRAYVAAGGACPRALGAHGFEDYEFWLRLTMLYRRSGVLLREPLFYYRRHDSGRSAQVRRQRPNGAGRAAPIDTFLLPPESGAEPWWRTELRQLAPYAFGELSRDEALVLSSTRDAGDESLRDVLPCVRRFGPSDEAAVPQLRFRQWAIARGLVWPVRNEAGRSMPSSAVWREASMYPNASIQSDPRLDGEPARLSNGVEDSDLDRPTLFPFNVLHLDAIAPLLLQEDNSTNGAVSVAYLHPWMVAGGAEQYDVEVLRALRALRPAGLHVSLLTARHVDQTAAARYAAPLTDEQFNLQLLTNDSRAAAELIDYLLESRGARLLVNSRTVPGYDAVERWGRLPNDDVDAGSSSRNRHRAVRFAGPPAGTVDILHMRHADSDHANWEHRSAR
ncbi:hypothetical protein HK405_009218, partial [Cladochytrium tenue]